MPETFSGRDTWKNLLGLFGVLIVLFLIFRYFDIEAIRGEIEGAGIWAPALLVLAKAATIVIAPLGGAPLYPLGGALFGFWKATALLLAGDALGGAISFYLSRWLGRRIVEKMIGQEGLVNSALDMMSTVKGFFVARVCLLTFPELASYSAGLTRLPFVPFILIHVGVGVAPTLVGVGLGEFIALGFDSFAVLGAVAVAGVVAMGGVVLFGWMVQKHALAQAALKSAERSPEEK